MGQKVSPIGLRVGVIRDWESRWYADKDYADLLLEDVKIREFLFAECKNASVSRVEIERSKNRVEIMIRTARPGVIIGTNGENVEMLKKKVEKLTGGKNIYLKVLEIANPDLDAKLVARSIADQLEQRASFRTAQKKAIQRTMRAGAKGIKTAVSGRLGGADMAPPPRYHRRGGAYRRLQRRCCTSAHTACRYRLCLGRSIYDLRSFRCKGLDLPW